MSDFSSLTVSEPFMLTIRSFQPFDQDAAKALVLAGLAERFNPFKPELNPDLDDIANNFEVFLVGYLEDKLVATGGLRIESPISAKVVRMSTAKAHRQRGFAAQILKELEAFAKAREIQYLTLVTNKDWVEAVAFYERYGFVRAEEYLDATGFQGVRFNRSIQ